MLWGLGLALAAGLLTRVRRSPGAREEGAGLTPRTLGQRGGTEGVILTSAQVPGHTHLWQGSMNAAGESRPGGNVTGGNTPVDIYAPLAGSADLSPEAVAEVGADDPHGNLQPFCCLHFIIALMGRFPNPD